MKISISRILGSGHMMYVIMVLMLFPSCSPSVVSPAGVEELAGHGSQEGQVKRIINLATTPMSGGGVAPAGEVKEGPTTSVRVEQRDKRDHMMEGCYYGYFFDQWPWQGGSGGAKTTLGPKLHSGPIHAEIDLCVEKAEIISGRLRFSVACASWEDHGMDYDHTEYDFWNGPEPESGVIWVDDVRIFKGDQFQLGKWRHLSLDISSLIRRAYGVEKGYLQAIYVVIEWDGNNSSLLRFRNFKLYREVPS